MKNTGLVIFSIIGSVLVGLGISLIVADNWDNFSVNVKTILGFIPVTLGIIIGLTAFFKFPASRAWSESAGVFWFLTTGASLAIISQVYQLQGDLGGFLVLWMLCAAPVLFLLKSRAAYILFILCSTWFVMVVKGNYLSQTTGLHYAWMFVIVLLFSWLFNWKNNAEKIFNSFLGWLLPFAFAIALGVISQRGMGGWMFLTYAAMFQLYILLNEFKYTGLPGLFTKGFGKVGLIGSISFLFYLSYERAIKIVVYNNLPAMNGMHSSAPFVALLLFIAVYVLFLWKYRSDLKVNYFMLPVVGIIILTGIWNRDIAAAIANLGILFFGYYTIQFGLKKLNIVYLNAGLSIISLLIILRFFDMNLSFLIRGLAFLLIGAGFFIVNKWLFDRRKKQGS